MGGQKVCLGDISPLSPPGSATEDKPNATTFIKPQLEFFDYKIMRFRISRGGGQLPPLAPLSLRHYIQHLNIYIE